MTRYIHRSPDKWNGPGAGPAIYQRNNGILVHKVKYKEYESVLTKNSQKNPIGIDDQTEDMIPF